MIQSCRLCSTHVLTNSDYFPAQHELIDFYYRDGDFTVRYELNICMSSRLIFVTKGLKDETAKHKREISAVYL